MSLTPNGIATKIYKKSSKSLSNKIDLDFETQRVFAAIDGRAQLSIVAKRAGVSIPGLWISIAKLTRLGLIENNSNETTANAMSKQFTDNLQRELAKAVGPVGNLLIKNVVEVTKISWPHIPADRAQELINRLALLIPDDSLREHFKQTMLKEL